jgi:hypothetical protein
MAQGREGQDDDKLTPGRNRNAARPLDAADDKGSPERYPPVRQDDAVELAALTEGDADEPRSFDPSADAPTPRQGAGDGSAPISRHTGPGGDPAEGKR